MNDHNPIHVLILDRDPAFAHLIKIFLEAGGFEAKIAVSPNHARQLFSDDVKRFSVLLTHVVMEATSGPELAGELQALNNDLRVVYSSSETIQDLRSRQLDVPDPHFLRKPFNQEQLLSKMRSVLEMDVP